MVTLVHYLRVAARNLARNKIFTLINMIGLAFGMLVCLMLIMLVANHLSFDRFNSKYDRIYRVGHNTGPNTGFWATAPLPIGSELIDQYPGIERVVRFNRGFGNMMANPLFERADIPISGLFADGDVLNVFEYELEHGDPNTALVAPYSVVLKKSTARKLFKQENPVGEILQVGEIGDYKVTGVLKETANQSHIDFEALASYSTLISLEAKGKSLDPAGLEAKNELENWESGHAWVYILLEEGKSTADIQKYLNEISKRHYFNGPVPLKWEFNLTALSEISPGRMRPNEIGPVMPWEFIYFLSAIALAILATSCFNFTTLSVARSLSRAKEIGVRKVSGALRIQIFTQFSVEAVFLSCLSLLTALFAMFILKPYFLALNLVKFGQIHLTGSLAIYLLFFAFAILVGMVAGFFPAVVLSALRPVSVLRNLSNMKVLSRQGMRRGLIIIQFVIALVFIVSTITVREQFNRFLNVDHLFDMHNNIVVELNKTSAEQLKAELLRSPVVENVSAASFVPAGFFQSWGNYKNAGNGSEWAEIRYFAVDEDYAKNLGLSIVAGRFFTQEGGASSRKFVVLNEEAARLFGYASPMGAVGQMIVDQRDSSNLQVIGVVKNYHSTLVTSPIQPTILAYIPEEFNILQVKHTGASQEAVAAIEAAWKKINPGRKPAYAPFADEVFKFYNLIFKDLLKILGTVSFFSIMICCLGLLGIVYYSMETRTKEISIRKICGASAASLMTLLSGSYVRLFVIAVLIGLPIAFVINQFWLEHLSNHINLGLKILGLSIAMLAILAGGTIFSQTLKAIRIRPVDNLKIE